MRAARHPERTVPRAASSARAGGSVRRPCECRRASRDYRPSQAPIGIPTYSEGMARYTLVYGIRLVPEGTLINADEPKLQLAGGDTAGLTLHTIDGTIPQLRRALDRSL